MSITKMRVFCSKYLSKWIFGALVLVFAIGSVAYFGGGGGSGEARDKEKLGQEVVALVNGKQVTRADLDQAVQARIDQAGPGAFTSPIQRDDLTMSVLQQLMMEKLKVSAAEKEGLSIGFFERHTGKNKLIDDEIEMLRQQIQMNSGSKIKLSDDDINKRLAYMNPPRTLDGLRHELDQELTGDKLDDTLLINKLEDKIKAKSGNLTDDQLQAVFESVKERHIVIRANSFPDPKAESKANKVLEQLKGGADFAAMAKQWSDDTATRDKGGEIPQYVSAMQDKDVEGLKKGQLSEVIKSPMFGGYRIIQVEDVKMTLPKDFAERKSFYRQQVKEQLLDKQAVQQYYQQAQSTSKIEIKDPELKAYWAAAQAISNPNPAARQKAAAEAVPLLLQAAKTSTNQAGVHAKLAEVYVAMGNNDKAIAELEDVTGRYRSLGADISLMLANLYLKKGEIAKVKPQLIMASNIGYGDKQVRSEVRDLYTKIGDKDGAAKEQKWLDETAAREKSLQPTSMAPTKPAPTDQKPQGGAGG